MEYLKLSGRMAAVAALLALVVGPGHASATRFYKYTTPSANDQLGIGTTYTSTMGPIFSFTVQDTLGGPADTCTGFHDHGHISAVDGVTLTSFSYTGCSHSTTILALGSIEVKHIAGTTNGTVVWKGTRITFKSTVFGLSCVANTGSGTSVGTITGAKSSSGNATIDINGVLTSEGLCGDSNVTGSSVVTSPTGLTIEAS